PKPVVLCPPTEVYFFLMGKIVRIKTIEFMEDLAFYEHTGTRCPKYLDGVIVLSHILFQFLKNTPSAKGIAERIQKTARCPGIFKTTFILIIQDLWLDNIGLRIVRKFLDDRS